jgi:DNA-binding NtrC family response regulator
MSTPTPAPRPTLPAGCVVAAPRTGSALPSVKPAPQPAAGPARARILFLDDEERIVNALKAIFRSQYEVHTATNGHEALALLRRQQFHLVVSDQRMPEMSGVDFLREAKVVSPRTIRMLLTGFADLSAIVGSVNDGEVYRYLTKPWRNRDIQAQVDEAIEVALELAADAAPTIDVLESAALGPEGVLVLYGNSSALRDEARFMGGPFKCHAASSASTCLSILQDEEIGVLVANVSRPAHETATLLRLLKREHPHILTIAVCDSADANEVIELINEAKVYRYLAAPYKPAQLRHFVDSAMQHYRRQKTAPVLVRQQKAAPANAPDTEFAVSMLARIRSLRRVFGIGAAARAG